jgi:AcrR family transcriptional regulator
MRTTTSDARQLAIITAARDLFARQGFHGTTMPEIAKAAKVSVGLIYYHFESKADILLAIVDESHAYSNTVFEDSQVIADPRERLDRVVHDLYTAIDKGAKLFLILYKDLQQLSREERRRIFKLEDENVDRITAIIREGQEKGLFAADIPDVPLLAANIIGLGHLWALKKTWYFASRLTLDEYIDHQLHYIHAILAGGGIHA